MIPSGAEEIHKVHNLDISYSQTKVGIKQLSVPKDLQTLPRLSAAAAWLKAGQLATTQLFF